MTTLSQAFAPGDLNFDLASAQNWQRGISTQRDSQDNRNNQQAIQDQIYGQQTNDKTKKKKKNGREKGESKQQKQQVKYLCILMRQNEWFDFDEKMSTKETEEQNKKEECALGTEI